jgi:hypothetical protein
MKKQAYDVTLEIDLVNRTYIDDNDNVVAWRMIAYSKFEHCYFSSILHGPNPLRALKAAGRTLCRIVYGCGTEFSNPLRHPDPGPAGNDFSRNDSHQPRQPAMAIVATMVVLPKRCCQVLPLQSNPLKESFDSPGCSQVF